MVPNPLDFRGPEFLGFYAITAIVVLGLLYVARAAREGGPAPRVDTGDPYLIAYLRGGANEALRVATIALVDRGLLVADAATGQVTARARPDAARRPIERAVLEHFADPHLASTIFHHPAPRALNFEFDAVAALGSLPLDRVRLGHLAGGQWIAARDGSRRLLDDHRHDVPDPVFQLLTELAALAPAPLTVLIERDGAYPAFDRLLGEIARARAALARGRAPLAA
jgi:hypothetical protein